MSTRIVTVKHRHLTFSIPSCIAFPDQMCSSIIHLGLESVTQPCSVPRDCTMQSEVHTSYTICETVDFHMLFRNLQLPEYPPMTSSAGRAATGTVPEGPA
jgi:hypothetical protein